MLQYAKNGFMVIIKHVNSRSDRFLGDNTDNCYGIIKIYN